MMSRYFVDEKGRIYSECVVDEPANPQDHLIVTLNGLQGDCRDYLFVEGVAVFSPLPVPRIVPRSVSRFQARAALLQAGLLDDVESFMALPETDPIYRLAWQDAQEFRRDSVIVASLKSVLLLTDVQIDDLFVFAASITG